MKWNDGCTPDDCPYGVVFLILALAFITKASLIHNIVAEETYVKKVFITCERDVNNHLEIIL